MKFYLRILLAGLMGLPAADCLRHSDLWFCGSSAIIDPRGVVVASASADREELIQADLSQEVVLAVRSRVQSLAHRRQDLYD